jgi:Rrf2 family protein
MATFLSQTTEYALRAMAQLATNPPDEPVRARDLSVDTEIPAHYLTKILRRLVLAGILDSQKGQGGGFRLARAPGEISFRDVLAAMDALPPEDRCAFGWGMCDATRPCPLHRPWSEMSREFRRWAATTTFGQVRRSAARRKSRGRGRRRR